MTPGTLKTDIKHKKQLQKKNGAVIAAPFIALIRG